MTSELSRWARRGLLLLGGLLALGQARAQLAPPPPPASTSITVSNGKSLAGWRAPLGDWKLVRAAAPQSYSPAKRCVGLFGITVAFVFFENLACKGGVKK